MKILYEYNATRISNNLGHPSLLYESLTNKLKRLLFFVVGGAWLDNQVGLWPFIGDWMVMAFNNSPGFEIPHWGHFDNGVVLSKNLK